jgi:Ca2+:H+ antiporter
LASLVGAATEQVGSRMSAGATGVLQSALGNLPELFIALFSLKAGLVTVVQSALVGSILGNNLLVLGLAFWAGGLKHGTQRFNSDAPKMIAALMLLAVSALAVPTLAAHLHTPAGSHVQALSVVCAVVLLLVFAASIPVSLKGSSPSCPDTVEPEEVRAEEAEHHWPLWLAIAALTGASVAAAFVSDWFVEALQPAIIILHLSPAFTGLVIVAIAGNAVENVVGIQLMRKNQPDYAVSVILNSPLQIALGLWPMLVLISACLPGLSNLTLVLPPLLMAALVLSSLVSTIVAFDGESIWLEGVSLVALYAIITAAFWWG